MLTQIAVLDASVGDTPAERNLTRELTAVDADVEVTTYKVSDGEMPPAATGEARRYDGVVVSGSQTSVYDDEPWIHELTAWARAAHRADIPLLGVCWGHQFLAQALGGRVVDMGEHELGYRTVERVGDDSLFAGLPGTFAAFQTHSDRVAELPPGATELARNEYGLQAFRLGSTYGVQFHPEYDRETAEWVIDAKDLSPDRSREVRGTLTERNVTAAREATRVFENFVAIVSGHARGSARDRAQQPSDWGSESEVYWPGPTAR